MFKRVIGALVSCVVLWAAAGSAQASSFTFNQVNDTVTVLYSFGYTDPNNTAPVPLAASITYKLTSLGTQAATFAVTVSNTTSAIGDNRISIFGVDIVTPSLNSASTNSSIFNKTALNSNMPSGIGKVDFCATANNNCSGGGGGGLGEGFSHDLTLTLGFTANVPPITFQNFAIRYQGVGFDSQGSIAFTGCVEGDTNCIPRRTDVPEPATLALVGLALAGMGVTRRRRAQH